MPEFRDRLEKQFENWIEWKFYKILYIGILVPLLFSESKKWIFISPSVSIIYIITAIILLLPTLFKILDTLNTIDEYVENG